MTYGGGRKELNNLEFFPEFFYDEVREGFYVSTMMKRYWASQLKVLSIIARICEKYDIRWYADYGTLLGAVRHGGYIPWDDDLDICMFRDDWCRFFEVAEKELPSGFKVLTIAKELEYTEIIGRVVNSEVIDYGKAHLDEFYGCPYTVGIDIFPLDGIFEDTDKEAARKGRAKRALSEIESYKAANRNYDSKRLNQLLKRVEDIYKECPVDEAKDLALMPFYVPKGTHVFPKELYEHIVKLPFEHTYINAPARYEELLTLEYGSSFLNVNMSGGMHDYPVYTDQEKILGEKLGGNPFRYTFNMQELLRSVSRYAKRMLKQSMSSGDGASERKKVVFLPCRASWWKSMEPLWRKYSEDETMEVHVLPIFYFDCDHNGNIGEKHDERALFPDYVKVEDCEKFDFSGIHPDEIITQVPYDGFDTAFTVHEFFYSTNLLNFTEELIYVPCFDMDDPINDNCKAASAISTFIEQEAVVNADRVVLRSEGLQQFYIKKLVELSSEDTRQYWEQKIVVMDGEKAVDSKAPGGETKARKTIVYYIGISSLLRYGSDALEKIRENLGIFEAAGDKIEAVLVPQEQILENLAGWEPQLWREFVELTESIALSANIIYDPYGNCLDRIEEWSAYYGDPSPYVRQCVEREIPVMIQNYETVSR